MKKLLNFIWNGISAISGLVVLIYSLGMPGGFFKPILVIIGALVLGINSIQLGTDISKSLKARKDKKQLQDLEEQTQLEEESQEKE
jgi:uncharacterized membrane protein